MTARRLTVAMKDAKGQPAREAPDTRAARSSRPPGNADRPACRLPSRRAPVAQWTERRTSNPRVAGSNPAGRMKLPANLRISSIHSSPCSGAARPERISYRRSLGFLPGSGVRHLKKSSVRSPSFTPAPKSAHGATRAYTATPSRSSRASPSGSTKIGWTRPATGCGVFRPSPVTSRTTVSAAPSSLCSTASRRAPSVDASRCLTEDAAGLSREGTCSSRSHPRPRRRSHRPRNARSPRRGCHPPDCRSQASGTGCPA